MKKLYLLIICIVLYIFIATIAKADPPYLSLNPNQSINQSYKGLDVLGIAKQRADILATEMDPNSALGWLEVTFGDAHPNVKTVLNTTKIIIARPHLMDGTVNNHGCTGLIKDLKELSKRAKSISELFKLYPNIQMYPSPVLEHGCTDKNIVNSWYTVLKRDIPNAKGFVCSTYKGYCPPGVKKESHGNKAKGDITSNDGQSIYDSNSWDYRDSGTLITFAWSDCDNGRTSSEKPGDIIPLPKNRINWCSRNDIKQKVRLLRHPLPKPSIPGCIDIQKPELLKTNAEYYGKGIDDGRGNKPLFISKNKYSTIDIATLQGKKVGFLKYFDTFSGGGYRNYIGRGGSNQHSVLLMDQLQSEWGLLKTKDVKKTKKRVLAKKSKKVKSAAKGNCWIFNSIRRLGYYPLN